MSSAPIAVTDAGPQPQTTSRRRWTRVWFWARRYLRAEIAGTLAVVAAGLVVHAWSGSPIATAGAATIAESVGFYAVIAVGIYREQRAVTRTRRAAAYRSALLIVAEFGPAELLDSLLVRPGLIALAVWLLPGTLWALLVGKVLADVVFYVIAAGAFTITERTGLRQGTGTSEVRSR